MITDDGRGVPKLMATFINKLYYYVNACLSYVFVSYCDNDKTRLIFTAFDNKRKALVVDITTTESFYIKESKQGSRIDGHFEGEQDEVGDAEGKSLKNRWREEGVVGSLGERLLILPDFVSNFVRIFS